MIEFGPYQLDPAAVRLVKNGQEIEIEPQVFNTLLLLIENRERVVTKDELFKEIWQGRSVTDHVITRIIYELRKILDGKSGQTSHIRTVRGKGYQFVAELNESINSSQFNNSAPNESTTFQWWKSRVFILLLLMTPVFGWLAYNYVKQPNHLDTKKQDWTKPNIYPIVAVLPIEVGEDNEKLSILVQSLIEYLTHQLAVNLNMKVIHPDSMVNMSDELDDVWAIQQATRSDYIIQGFVETLTNQSINLHLSLFKNTDNGELIPFKLGVFKFPYPNDYKELNSLFKERKVTVRNIIQIIKPGVVVKDNGETETNDPEAYRLVIAAHHMSRNDDCNELRRAETLLLSAVDKDDEFAYAYYQLFANYFKRVWLCGDAIEYHQKALEMAEIVERLAPNTYSPVYKGRNAILIESNQVEKAYEFSKDASWNDPDELNHKVYGLRFAGFFDEASSIIDRILQIDPYYYSEKPINQAPNTLMYQNRFEEYMALLAEPGSSYHDYYRSLSLVLSNQNDQAQLILRNVIERESGGMFDYLSQALSFIIAKNNDAAINIADVIMQKRIEKKHTDGEMTYKLVQLYALAGAHDQALNYLQLSVNQGFFPMNLFLIDPALNTIRNSDQFVSIYNQAKKRHEAFAKRFDLIAETQLDLTQQG